ncbi:MAG: DUF1573 domain-containing protein [Bacteroidales bacterium]|jgi:hypothetical protein|nr:DUF1573 domain-containing protein [Bacteroidales bacterium]
MNKTLSGILTFIVYFSFALTACPVNKPKAMINWSETAMDFGQVPYNQPIEVEFRFQNSGMFPLIINNVEPSCGCTVADFPKQPIPAGGEGSIKVTFDAKLSGYFSKTITVHSNTEEKITTLFIKGEVVK